MATGTEIIAAKGVKLLSTPAVRETGLSLAKMGLGVLKAFAVANPVTTAIIGGLAVGAVVGNLLFDD